METSCTLCGAPLTGTPYCTSCGHPTGLVAPADPEPPPAPSRSLLAAVAGTGVLAVLVGLAVAASGAGAGPGGAPGGTGDRATDGPGTATPGPDGAGRAEVDLPGLLRTRSGGVVRVTATTCGGTGVGTGFLVAPDLLLTAAPVVRGAQAVAVTSLDPAAAAAAGTDPTADLRVGTLAAQDDTAGVALVRLSSPRPGQPFALAPAEATEEVPGAVLGIPLGRPVAATGAAVPAAGGGAGLRTDGVLDAGALGAPVLDPDGAVLGLVVAQGAGGARVVGAGVLAPLLDTWRAAGTAAPTPCDGATGPQHAELAPVLPRGADPVAAAVAETVEGYVRDINAGFVPRCLRAVVPGGPAPLPLRAVRRGSGDDVRPRADGERSHPHRGRRSPRLGHVHQPAVGRPRPGQADLHEMVSELPPRPGRHRPPHRRRRGARRAGGGGPVRLRAGLAVAVTALAKCTAGSSAGPSAGPVAPPVAPPAAAAPPGPAPPGGSGGDEAAGERWVQDVLVRMGPAEKAGQVLMTYAYGASADDASRGGQPRPVRRAHAGRGGSRGGPSAGWSCSTATRSTPRDHTRRRGTLTGRRRWRRSRPGSSSWPVRPDCRRCWWRSTRRAGSSTASAPSRRTTSRVRWRWAPSGLTWISPPSPTSRSARQRGHGGSVLRG